MLGFVVCNTDHVAGVQLSPAPLQMFTTFGVTFLASAATKSDILIALSRVAVCRSGSTITSTTKGLSQYKLLFALSLGVILLHQKKNHQTIVFLVPHAGLEPAHQRMVPELESGVSTSFTNGACR